MVQTLIDNRPRWGSLLPSGELRRRNGRAWTQPAALILSLCLLLAALPASAQRGYTQKARPTPTPIPNRAADMAREIGEVYEGYARLFVLGHVFTRVMGMEGVLPTTINLDFFANQPLLAESGDVFIYRPSARGDIMWPLILPTPPRESPTPIPTDTPTPELAALPESTPTPTPTATPTEVVPPPLKLQAVSKSPTGALIMISDTMLTVGDVIDGATVTDIKKRFARVLYFGKEFVVTAQGTVKSEDFREEDLPFD
ncbi:MAG: hypothetical protein GHCLOJNM_00238 [bacterium]|nr:hypothetical protein [bacterium]